MDGAGRNVAIAGRAAEVGWALVLEKRLARATVLGGAALLVAGMGPASGVRTGIVCCLVGTAPGKAACMSLYHVYYTAAPVFAEWVCLSLLLALSKQWCYTLQEACEGDLLRQID